MMGLSLNLNIAVGGPYALPNGAAPLTVADFKNGVYMLNGSAVDPSEVVEAIASWDASWSVANNVTPGVGSTGNPCINKALGESYLAGGGITLVAAFRRLPEASPFGGILDVENFNDPDFTQNLGVNAETANSYVYEYVDNVLTERADITPDTFVDDLNKLVWSIESAGASITASLNGSPTKSLSISGTLLVNAIGMGLSAGAVLESVGIYPLQAAADLPTLSALT